MIFSEAESSIAAEYPAREPNCPSGTPYGADVSGIAGIARRFEGVAK